MVTANSAVEFNSIVAAYCTCVKAVDLQGILKTAGGPGNRWLLGRKAQQREESPDTVLRHGQRFVGQNS
jgi:hypothetical protein